MLIRRKTPPVEFGLFINVIPVTDNVTEVQGLSCSTNIKSINCFEKIGYYFLNVIFLFVLRFSTLKQVKDC